MRIVYIGDSQEFSGACRRAVALRRLGHEVTHLDLDRAVVKGGWQGAFHYRTGYRLLRQAAGRWLGAQIGDLRFDLAWVDGGAVLGSDALLRLRVNAPFLVNYNNDDPMGRRDRSRWHTYRQAITQYDLLVVVRQVNESELRRKGARAVRRVFMSYDDEMLRSAPMKEDEAARWRAEVLFVGTWMPERGPFLAELVGRGVPLSIYGNRWDRAAEQDKLRGCIQGCELRGPDYVKAIQNARICLGLLSKGNRDLHTTRSGEIPFIGSLFCGERTSEHSAMYREGEEAVFWSDAGDCARQCLALLADEPRRRRIAAAGRERVQALHLTHVDVLAEILDQILLMRGQ